MKKMSPETEAATVFDLAEARDRYQSMLERFRNSHDESVLMSFNDLGMAMNRAGVPPELAVETHAIAIQTLQTRIEGWPWQDNTLLLPLMEVIMAYGVTFRHQLSAQQRASEAQFVQVLEQASDMIFITGTDGVVTYANPAYRRAMGLGEGVATDSRPMFIDFPDCAAPADLWSALADAQSFKGIMAALDGQQRRQSWSVSAFPLFRNSDAPDHYVFVAADISEQLAIRKRLRRSERLATLGEIASGVSHEFNNILLIISGFAELVKEDSGSMITADFADEILKAVEKGQNLNQQILSFSQERDIDAKPTRLGTLLGRVRPLVQSALGSGITLTLDCPGDPIVTLNEDHLCQMLTNLCINARHAIEERAGPEAGTVHCWFETDGAMLVLNVRDNGTGMDAGTQRDIFEPFFTTKRTGEGSGLGLSIILRIVDQYHGHIDVSSELGNGTHFRLSLPVVYGG